MPQKRESCAAGPAYPALRWRNAASKAVGDAMQKFAFLTLQVTSGARVVAVQGIFHFPMKLTRIGRTPCCQDPFRMFRYAHLRPLPYISQIRCDFSQNWAVLGKFLLIRDS